MENLPHELWLEVFSHLLPHRSGRLLRVNRQWFKTLAPWVWEKVEDVHLLSVLDHRRQLYASFIQELSIVCADPEKHNQLNEVAFIKLTGLVLPVYAIKPPGSSLTQYILPTLRSVEIEGEADSSILDYILPLLQVNCPGLLRLSLDFDKPSSSPEPVLSLLRTCSSLEAITVGSTTLDSDNHRALRQMFTYRNLKKIIYYPAITRDVAAAADISSLPSASPSLESALMTLHWDVLPFLVRGFRNLSRLNLMIRCDYGAGDLILTPLSQLTNLRHLRLSLFQNPVTSPAHLVSLGALTKLTELDLHGMPGTTIAVRGFDDNHFKTMLSGLPNLKQLGLQLAETKLTTLSLVVAGQCCPRLRTLNLTVEADMMTLQPYDAPLFPDLETLRISMLKEGVPKEENYIARKIAVLNHASVLDSHFPETLQIEWSKRQPEGGEMGFYESVLREWRALRLKRGKTTCKVY